MGGAKDKKEQIETQVSDVPKMKLKDWINLASTKIDRLDAELIAIKALNLDDKIDLILYSEDEFDFQKADKMVENREKGIPIAYILGVKEFYSRNFRVNSNVLIPRPETEEMIRLALETIENEKIKAPEILDVGTGSGCIAITMKLELDTKKLDSKVTGVDYSVPALDLAQDNADDLDANVDFFSSDLLSAIKNLPDIIMANLPYVDLTWDWTSPELKYEPALALYADDHGLKLIKKLIDEIVEKLPSQDVKKRFLFLEADTSQLDQIINYAKSKNFTLLKRTDFILEFSY